MAYFHSSSRCGAFSARTIAVILCLLFCPTVALPARAGGIYANEYGTPEMGTAGAGAEASMFEPGDVTRIGISYVSETEFDYSGDITRTPRDLTAPANTTLTLAQTLRLGIHHDISPTVAIVGTLGWEDWSALKKPVCLGR